MFLAIYTKFLQNLNHFKVKCKKKKIVISKANNTVKMSIIDVGEEMKKIPHLFNLGIAS